MDATFRLLANYVNFMISRIYYAVLHNLLLEPIVNDDEIIIFHHNYCSKIRFGNPKRYKAFFATIATDAIYRPKLS